MEFSANQIAAILNGIVEGNGETKVSGISRIQEGKMGTLTFFSNTLYEEYVYTTIASIILVNKDFIAQKPISIHTTLIRVDNAYESIAVLLNYYDAAMQPKAIIHNTAIIESSSIVGEGAYIGAYAYIAENVKIGKNAKIYPHVYIGNGVEIGDNVVLYSGVKIYHQCKIGHDCTFHAGVVIGSDGFGFAPSSVNDYKKIPQIGNVIIEDHVEIGANCAIDRATIGSTIIRKGVKLDNLIQIAHNVEIGEHTVIAGQSAIAGSAKIGKNCMIAGQVGIIGHITIGDNVKIAGQTGVGNHVPDNAVIQGSPAFNHMDYNRSYAIFRNLPKRWNEITSQIKELKQKLEGL
jgi:UDP-3-O-[3-hydroxymyristoyl] glucosamine N-acyltransferase